MRLLSVRPEAARTFYETEALRCGWSVRQLDRHASAVLLPATLERILAVSPATPS